MKMDILLTSALCSGLLFLPLAADAEDTAPAESAPRAKFRQIPAESLAASPKAEPTRQLYYDVTACTDDPFSAPAIQTWDCTCSQTNIYLDTRGLGAVEVLPVYSFIINGERFSFPWDAPVLLDEESQWVLWLTWPNVQFVGDGFYEAGVEYQGEFFFNLENYPLTINCP